MEINKNKAKHTTASAVVKKCLSMVLALCMVLAMVPAGTITAFAAGDDSTTGAAFGTAPPPHISPAALVQRPTPIKSPRRSSLR